MEVRVERSAKDVITPEKIQKPAPPVLSSADTAFLKSFGVNKLQKVFKPVFSAEEKTQVMEALRLLTGALDKLGVDYFLYGGSLIGSWRHHDVIPWDDDLDIIVNISNWEKIERIKIPGHTLNVQTLNRYKFYSDNATDIPGYFWKWPYIDICFFGDNGTHLYDMDPNYSKTFVYDKNDVLPLSQRPFGSLWLKVPKNTEIVLSQNYNVNICKTRSYNHQQQVTVKPGYVKSVECSMLYRLYPFVIRPASQPKQENNKEQLYLNGKLLKTSTVS